MANEYVLDAHALVWFLEGNPRLGVNARAVMQNAPNKSGMKDEVKRRDLQSRQSRD